LLICVQVLSLALAGGSILVMALVLLARLFRTRRERVAAAQRDEARQLLVACLDDEVTDATVDECIAQHSPAALVAAAGGLVADLDAAGRARLRTVMRHLDPAPYRAALRSRRRRGRLSAVHVLSAIGDSEVIDDLRSMLDDRDAHIRLAAAKALAELEAVPPVAEVIHKIGVVGGHPPRVLFSILQSLVPRRSAELMALVREDGLDVINVLAIDALGYSGDPTLAPRIAGALSFTSVNVRAAALRALARLGNRQVRIAVRAALADPSWEVRCQAAFCTGRLKIIDAAAELEALLGDEQWWVRFRAAEALRAIGEIGFAILRRTSKTPDPAGQIAEAILEEKAA
jgi:HEAT repeat protein